jgi:leucyl aminopeptidase
MVLGPPLPALPRAPQILRREHLSERGLDALDALVALVPADADDTWCARLPQSERWRGLHAQAPPVAGVVRSTALTNAHQTRAVLGYLRRQASAFETLALAGKALKESSAREPRSLALAAPFAGAAAGAALDALLAAALAQAFPLPQFRRRGGRAAQLSRIVLLGGARLDLRYAEAAARGNNIARFLTALPPNVLDVRGYRRFIGEQARAHRLSLRWLDERALRRLGAGAFLAVSAGNAERTAGIAHLSYRPRRPKARAGVADVALVGKGILFDTGGTNLKPHRAMLDMHIDMSGSAVALATLLALARLDAPFAADAWLAITENRIGPSAYVPQQVVRAANGVTIQVIHTDAEGRMVLADTLALACRRQPRLLMDFATLTGSCVYALTERMSGIFTNEPRLEQALIAAGRASGERVWPFPLDADYDSDIESRVADVLQCASEGKGDHILAARFLGRFVPEGTPWVHVDLSSALRSGGLAHISTDVTGFGVRYALELLLHARVLEHLERRR